MLNELKIKYEDNTVLPLPSYKLNTRSLRQVMYALIPDSTMDMKVTLDS